MPAHKRRVAHLFDTQLRAERRDRAARIGPELFLVERTFQDCLERIGLLDRLFDHALLIGCPDPRWPERLNAICKTVAVRDPGPLFARNADGEIIIEDAWMPPEAEYDLVIAIGTLDTVNDLPLTLRLIRHAMVGRALFIGALSGGETLPQLRAAMRAADVVAGAAAPHVHPRIEPSALAPLLSNSGFVNPVVDLDRIAVSYSSLAALVADLRAIGAANVLVNRPDFVSRKARAAAIRSFNEAGDGERTTESFEIIHFAAWTPEKD